VFCPDCEIGFGPGIRRCEGCGGPLTVECSRNEQETEPGQFVRIPVSSEDDLALLQSLLEGAGFAFHSSLGARGIPASIMISQQDLAEIKEFLSEYRINGTDKITW